MPPFFAGFFALPPLPLPPLPFPLPLPLPLPFLSLPLPELDELDELLEELLEEEELLLDELEEDELLLLEDELLLELLEEEELLEDIRSASAPFSASTWARPQSSPNSASISALIYASSSRVT